MTDATPWETFEVRITVAEHAPLISFRLSRARCGCLCGWQTRWREAISDVQAEWEQHLEHARSATR